MSSLVLSVVREGREDLDREVTTSVSCCKFVATSLDTSLDSLPEHSSRHLQVSPPAPSGTVHCKPVSVLPPSLLRSPCQSLRFRVSVLPRPYRPSSVRLTPTSRTQPLSALYSSLQYPRSRVSRSDPGLRESKMSLILPSVPSRKWKGYEWVRCKKKT